MSWTFFWQLLLYQLSTLQIQNKLAVIKEKINVTICMLWKRSYTYDATNFECFDRHSYKTGYFSEVPRTECSQTKLRQVRITDRIIRSVDLGMHVLQYCSFALLCCVSVFLLECAVLCGLPHSLQTYLTLHNAVDSAEVGN